RPARWAPSRCRGSTRSGRGRAAGTRALRGARAGSGRVGLGPLVPVAPQALPGLPEGRDAVVLVGVLVRVHPGADALLPAFELGVKPFEVGGAVGVDPEVDECQPFGVAAGQLARR